MKDVTVKKEIVVIVGILLVVALLVGAGFLANSMIKSEISKIRTEGAKLGYEQALYDIAYTIADKGEAVYLVPTTNITISVVLKK